MSASLLSIESSGTLCSVCVTSASAECYLQSTPEQKHTEVILGMISQVVQTASTELANLDAVAFGSGPGAFTGLRVACGIAQGIGWALEKKLIPVCDLYALALNQIEALQEGQRILVATDARMGECYCAIYHLDQGNLLESYAPALSNPEELLALADDYEVQFLAGNGFDVYKESIGVSRAALLSVEPCNALMVNKAAQLLFSNGLLMNPELATPLYVRDNVALTIEQRQRLKEAK